MRYVLLAYGDEQQLNGMSSTEREALRNACRANDAALWQSGHLLAVAGLESSRATTTVRVENNDMSITVGPLTETGEQLIGIFVIAARDLNEAIQVAATMPQARHGPIEVRPLMSLDQLSSPTGSD